MTRRLETPQQQSTPSARPDQNASSAARCAQCGCRPGRPSLHVISCSACGRGRASPGDHAPPRRRGRYAMVTDPELPPMWVRLWPWQRAARRKRVHHQRGTHHSPEGR